ncbi:hypothetical protein SDC9_79577 [bioreactor metagenome]|uniref:Glycosyltransferase RgtA/B/C/D-like domain-containing protein n=1 Tax=bioreactor metagenome TaxID=1076179 RepID=A0A644YWM7_9ZZZZ
MEATKEHETKKDRDGAGKPLVEWIFCLVVSAALLAVCSRSSPFYPINYWVDANCFFTVGKSMMNGLVTYRDIYEQKGPLLYFLHGLAYLISNDGFLGVYLIETLAFASFLLSMVRIMKLYTARVPYLLPAVLGALIATSNSFVVGDSAEEICLPFISWSLYYMLKLLRETKSSENTGFSLPVVMLNGILAGCVLWIKFNLLGFHLGWIIVLCILTLRKGGLIQALKTGTVFLLGMLAATLPWITYFGIHYALGDLWMAYFHNNIFLYSVPSASVLAGLKNSISNFLVGLYHNPGHTLPVAVGMLWTLFCPRKYLSVSAKAGIYATFALLAAGVYVGGRAYAYYALIFSAYAVLGCLPVLRLIGAAASRIKHSPARATRTLLSVMGLVLCIVFAYRNANDTFQFGTGKSATVQYRFSEIMHQFDDNPTLLNYGFLDGGFYTAANIVPNCKYFCILNIPLQEMWDSQDEYLRSGKVEFVVTRDKVLDTNQFEKYEFVSSDSFYSSSYFLYRLST